MPLPRLLLLTDRHQLPPGRSLLDTVRACAGAGLTMVVLRELDLPDPDREALADSLAEHVDVIAAHRPAGRCNAVLSPLSALSTGHSGSRTPRYMPLGASCHSAADVHLAAGLGAAFATLSPFAPTPSKPGYGPPLGREEYAAAVAAGIPVHALGGITADNAADAVRAGADGVAVMGAVMRAQEPAAVVSQLLTAVS